jgi:flagellar biosynthesis GTPase FlhF
MEDLIPVSKSNAKPIDDVKLKRSKDVVISQWQDGIEINIKNNTKNYDMYKIHDTFEALKNKNVIITKFLSAIKKYMI